MKKVLYLVALIVFFANCSDETESPEPAPSRLRMSDKSLNDILQKDSLRILDIGNSYTEDVTAFLPQVASACGVDVSSVCLYSTVRGKGSFKTWYDCYYDSDNASYSINKILGGIDACATTGTFGPDNGEPLRNLLQKDKWDVIILHPASTYAPYYETWFTNGSGGYLGKLLPLIYGLQPQAIIGFYVVHSYSSNYEENHEGSTFDRWMLTANSVATLMDSGNCDLVIPYGTAIENLRLSSLNNEYDLTRDGTHLESGVARYAAACCYYESIFAPRYGVSVVGHTFSWNGQQEEADYPVVDIDEFTAGIAQKAAVLAVQDWLHCHNPETAVLPVMK